MSRRFALWLAIGASMVAVASCALETESGREAPRVTQRVASTTATSVAASTSTTDAPALDSTDVDNCVRYVTYGAFLGDEALAQLWNDSNQDEADLRALCEDLRFTAPDHLAALSVGWVETERSLAEAEAEAARTQAALDATTTTTTTVAPPPPQTAAPAQVYYANCAEARAAGAAPLYRGQPGYRSGLDRDNDGVACE